MDITGELESFIAGKAGWRRERGAELARDTARRLDGELDWDEDAGEAVVVLEVPGLDAVVLRCDPGVLRAAFGDRVVDNPALDADAFSAGDLWFTTV
jgi:hypothetical protein